MTSRFDHFRTIFEQPSAERPKSREQREAERQELRADLAEGQRLARKQAAREPDRTTDYDAWCTEMAHRITDAGRRVRGMKPLFSDKPSPEYPDSDNYNSPGDPDDGGDDSPTAPKKGKKKAKPAVADDDDAEEKDEGETSDGNDEIEKKKRGAANCQPGESVSAYWARVDASAAAIVRAAQRRRGEIQ